MPGWGERLACPLRNRTARRFKDEVDRLRLSWHDLDLLRHGAQLFVPGLHGVLTRRQITQVKAPVFPGHGEERMLKDRNVAAHPGMHITLHGDGNLLAREAFFNRGATR